MWEKKTVKEKKDELKIKLVRKMHYCLVTKFCLTVL